MGILQQEITSVKSKANVFSPAEKDRATLGSDLSVSVGSSGERALAFSMSGDKFQEPVFLTWERYIEGLAVGSVSPLEESLCDKPNSLSPQGVVPVDNVLPENQFHPNSLYLDTCKQVGILCGGLLFPMSISVPVLVPVSIPDPIKFRFNNDLDPDWEAKNDRMDERREHLADVLFDINRIAEAGRVRKCHKTFMGYKAGCCGDTMARPMSCGHRLCPSCMQWASANTSKKIEQLIWYMKYPKHWTFTFANDSHIDKGYYEKVDKCFKLLMHRKCFKDVVKGGVCHVETSFNDEKETWHVHVHAILDAQFIDIEELKDAWKEITQAVMGKEAFEIRYHTIDKSGKLVGADIENVEQAVREISKYIVKPGNFLSDPSFVNEYLNAVDGQRLLTTFGNCYQSVIFRVDLSVGKHLDIGTIPLELVKAFKAKKIELLSSARVVIKKQGLYWIIVNGYEEYRVKDNENKDEKKRKLNISRKIFDDDEAELPDCFCGKNKWMRIGFVSVGRVFRDVKGYYRLKPVILDG
jgi:hypothetical protein